MIVDEIDRALRACARADAEILRELHDTDYGSREYVARDPEGNIWSFRNRTGRSK